MYIIDNDLKGIVAVYILLYNSYILHWDLSISYIFSKESLKQLYVNFRCVKFIRINSGVCHIIGGACTYVLRLLVYDAHVKRQAF